MHGAGKFLWILGVGALLAPAVALAQAPAAGDPALQVIIEQNRELQAQVKAQQKTIEALNARMEEVHQASERQERALQSLQERADSGPAEKSIPIESSRDHEVRIGGEAGLAFFSTGSAGQFPKSEFRVDDTTVTVEAPVWKDVYFFSELKLLTRESSTPAFQFGELYVDFEGLGSAWGRPDSLNFRAGSLNTPFGEEYLVRGPVENALITHSLSDIWGPDEGVEVYGSWGKWSYALAMQNGGISQLHDFNSDKSFAGRLGWDPSNWLHLSASAMRTGGIATVSPVTTTGDNLSALWFANGFFRALGPATRTSTFWADLYEVDAVTKWKNGHVRAALGQVDFNDDDPLRDHTRHLRYGFLEAMQSITEQLYGAARFSAIDAPGGYPLAGQGNSGQYFFQPAPAEELRRLSLGFGYRFGPPLVLKLEYSWEWGHQVTGESRDKENFFGAEVGLKF